MGISDQTIGELIRERRLAVGLSQTRLADRLGTSRQRVILWEGDKHVPSTGYAQQLAAELGGAAADYLPPPYAPLTLRADVDELQRVSEELAAALRKLARAQAADAESIAALSGRVLVLEQRATPATRGPRSRRPSGP